MPWRIRKAPGKQLYWVVGRDGSHMSKEPIPLSRAKAQMRALYASEREQDMRGGVEPIDIRERRFGPEVFVERPERAAEIRRIVDGILGSFGGIRVAYDNMKRLIENGLLEQIKAQYRREQRREPTEAELERARTSDGFIQDLNELMRENFTVDYMVRELEVPREDATDFIYFWNREHPQNQHLGPSLPAPEPRPSPPPLRGEDFDASDAKEDDDGFLHLPPMRQRSSAVYDDSKEEEDDDAYMERMLRNQSLRLIGQLIDADDDGIPEFDVDMQDFDDDEENPGLVGRGLGDFFKSVKERVTAVFRGIRRDYTPYARQTIAQFGNGRIVGMSLRRAPIQGYLNKFLNLLTAGAWARAKAEAKYDNLYHLSLVAMVEMPGQAVVPILIEKNQVINISPTIRMQPGTQFMNVEFEPGTFTLAEFLANGQQAMGDKYFLYDGFYNNCQDFLLGLLRANGIQDVNSERFIKQPLSELIKRLPWYSHVASRGLTDLAAVVDVAVYGRGKKSSEEGETMYGAGRYASVLEAVKGDLIRLRDWEVSKFKPRGSEKFDAETEWEERIINAAAEMAGLPEVPERLTAAQKSAYVRALKRYVALGRSSERRVALPRASAEAPVSYAVPVPNSGDAFIIEREARVAREAEAGRTAAAVRAMAAPLSRALDSTTTQVRPISGYALAAANLPGRWNQYDFGAAAETAAGLDAYAYRRHYDQDAKLEEREDMMEMAEHALDRVESGLVRGNVMLDLRPARSLGSELAELGRMEYGQVHARPAAAASAPGVVSALAGSDEGAMYADMPPLERVEADAGRAMASAVAASSGAEAVAAPAAAAASSAAGLPAVRMSLASASNEQILDLLRSGYGIPDFMSQFNASSAAVIAKLRRLPGAVTDPEVNALVRGAEDAFNAQRYAEQRAESAAAVRVEADAAAADAGVRAAAAADAPRDEVTGEGKPKLRRPRLKKPTGKVVMDFKDFKGEHTGLIKLLGEAANKLSKEAKEQAGELKTYETNKARRGLMSKKEKEALAGLRRGGAEAAPPKRGRGRPKGSKNKPKGAGIGDILTGIASVGEKLMKPALSNLGKVPGLLPPGGQKAIDAALGVAKSVADTIPARSGDDIIVSSLMGRKRRGRGEPRKAAMAKMKEALREKPETEAKAAKELEKIHSGKTARKALAREAAAVGKAIQEVSGKGKGEKWIQEAVEKPGAFEAQAKRAKMSVQDFADHVLANPTKYQARTRQRAQFAKTMGAMAAKKKRSPKKGKKGDAEEAK